MIHTHTFKATYGVAESVIENYLREMRREKIKRKGYMKTKPPNPKVTFVKLSKENKSFSDNSGNGIQNI
jgi:hypothetical protein